MSMTICEFNKSVCEFDFLFDNSNFSPLTRDGEINVEKKGCSLQQFVKSLILRRNLGGRACVPVKCKKLSWLALELCLCMYISTGKLV